MLWTGDCLCRIYTQMIKKKKNEPQRMEIPAQNRELFYKSKQIDQISISISVTKTHQVENY